MDACLSGEGQSGAPIWVSVGTNSAAIIGVLTSTPFNSRYVAPDGETETCERPSAPLCTRVARPAQQQRWLWCSPWPTHAFNGKAVCSCGWECGVHT